MEIMSIRSLPFPKIGQPVRNYKLELPLLLEQWIIPAGTVVKLIQTENFGWVSIPQELDIPKHIFKY